VALNLYDFDVRQPNKPTEKYGLRAYDEIILAPMVLFRNCAACPPCLSSPAQCIFEPRIIEFDRKRTGKRTFSPDVVEHVADDQAVGAR
jgi:actin-related protein 8